jgi:hypothetical protein
MSYFSRICEALNAFSTGSGTLQSLFRWYVRFADCGAERQNAKVALAAILETIINAEVP